MQCRVVEEGLETQYGTRLMVTKRFKNGGVTWRNAIQDLDRRMAAGEDIQLSNGVDLQKIREEEERGLQLYRRAKDVWFRLSESERNAMREHAKKQYPFLRRSHQ